MLQNEVEVRNFHCRFKLSTIFSFSQYILVQLTLYSPSLITFIRRAKRLATLASRSRLS